jgi:hypothetical protein
MIEVVERAEFPCPACGFLTMSEPPGSYNICEVCGWEDDHVQLADPRYRGGANHESLVEAQQAALQRFPIDVQIAVGFRRDRTWRPLREDEAPVRDDAPKSGREYFEAAAADGVPSYYWKK